MPATSAGMTKEKTERESLLFEQRGGRFEAPTSEAEMRRVARAAQAPSFANMVEGGKTPIRDAKSLEAMGFAVVAYPVGATFLIARALERYYGTLRRDGSSAALANELVSFVEFSELVGLPEVRQQEAAWIAGKPKP